MVNGVILFLRINIQQTPPPDIPFRSLHGDGEAGRRPALCSSARRAERRKIQSTILFPRSGIDVNNCRIPAHHSDFFITQQKRVSDPLYVPRLAEPSGQNPISGMVLFAGTVINRCLLFSQYFVVCAATGKRVGDPLYVYFPIQNREKIESSTSSLVMSPVMVPRSLRAARRSIERKSPVMPWWSAVMARRTLSRAF